MRPTLLLTTCSKAATDPRIERLGGQFWGLRKGFAIDKMPAFRKTTRASVSSIDRNSGVDKEMKLLIEFRFFVALEATQFSLRESKKRC